MVEMDDALEFHGVAEYLTLFEDLIAGGEGVPLCLSSHVDEEGGLIYHTVENRNRIVTRSKNGSIPELSMQMEAYRGFLAFTCAMSDGCRIVAVYTGAGKMLHYVTVPGIFACRLLRVLVDGSVIACTLDGNLYYTMAIGTVTHQVCVFNDDGESLPVFADCLQHHLWAVMENGRIVVWNTNTRKHVFTCDGMIERSGIIRGFFASSETESHVFVETESKTLVHYQCLLMKSNETVAMAIKEVDRVRGMLNCISSHGMMFAVGQHNEKTEMVLWMHNGYGDVQYNKVLDASLKLRVNGAAAVDFDVSQINPIHLTVDEGLRPTVVIKTAGTVNRAFVWRLPYILNKDTRKVEACIASTAMLIDATHDMDKIKSSVFVDTTETFGDDAVAVTYSGEHMTRAVRIMTNHKFNERRVYNDQIELYKEQNILLEKKGTRYKNRAIEAEMNVADGAARELSLTEANSKAVAQIIGLRDQLKASEKRTKNAEKRANNAEKKASAAMASLVTIKEESEATTTADQKAAEASMAKIKTMEKELDATKKQLDKAVEQAKLKAAELKKIKTYSPPTPLVLPPSPPPDDQEEVELKKKHEAIKDEITSAGKKRDALQTECDAVEEQVKQIKQLVEGLQPPISKIGPNESVGASKRIEELMSEVARLKTLNQELDSNAARSHAELVGLWAMVPALQQQIYEANQMLVAAQTGMIGSGTLIRDAIHLRELQAADISNTEMIRLKSRTVELETTLRQVRDNTRQISITHSENHE
jgi:hypothetical protein